MTLSNERRAHDLAIAAIQTLSSNLASVKLPENEDGNKSFDIYAIYLDVYNSSLAKFNEDFPNE